MEIFNRTKSAAICEIARKRVNMNEKIVFNQIAEKITGQSLGPDDAYLITRGL